MPEIIISKEYNINSDKLLKTMYDENFMKFLVENTEDIDDYNIIKKEFSDNKNILNVESNTICSINFPDYVKKIIGDYNSYKTITKASYDLKNKKANVKIESFYFKFLLLKINYNFKITQSENNKCIRETKFIYNSNLPLFGSKINNLIKSIITNQEDDIYKTECKYIEKNKLNISSL